jgi:hypothetical protein
LLKGLNVQLWNFFQLFLLSFLVAYFEAYSSTLGGFISDLFLFYKSLKVVGPSFLKMDNI